MTASLQERILNFQPELSASTTAKLLGVCFPEEPRWVDGDGSSEGRYTLGNMACSH